MYTTKRTLKDSLTSFLYPLKSIARCIREGIMTNKTWGGRFKKSLDSRVNQFNASLAFDHVLFDQDINGSQVHVKQLAKQQILTEAESQAIFSALEEIRSEIKQGQYSFNERDEEDIHMFIEQLLTQKLGELGKKLHTGRSRNDQVALDLRLYTRDKGYLINELLTGLIDCLDDLTSKHQQDLMPGYTHLQQAQPVTLGTYFNAYQSMFSRDKSRLEDWFKRMNYSPLGAGALAGSTLPLDREWVAESLGFTGIISNTLDAVSDRDFVIELCSVAAMIMMHLSRLCEDLILWSTQEFDFITLDDAFATGSSLMPNKKNPDVPELIRGKSGRVYGHLMAILTVMKGLPLAYNKDMQEDKEGLFDTINTIIGCLQIITPFLQSLTFNTPLMRAKAQSGYLDATAILESLVMKGIPFRDAHHQVGLWIAEAIEKQCSLTELLKGG
ncbi:TPA: argininosuccinate lyase [Legionella pneumophila]|nr:argininosuccinate lyase [Legionella pneumophila]